MRYYSQVKLPCWGFALYLFSLLSTLTFLVKCESHSVVSTLCNPMEYTVFGILQARILEWAPFLSPGDLLNPGIKPRSPAVQAGFFTSWATREAFSYKGLFLQDSIKCYSYPWGNIYRNRKNSLSPSQILTPPNSSSHTGRTDTRIRKTHYIWRENTLYLKRSIFKIVFSRVINHSSTKYGWKKPHSSAFYPQFVYTLSSWPLILSKKDASTNFLGVLLAGSI